LLKFLLSDQPLNFRYNVSLERDLRQNRIHPADGARFRLLSLLIVIYSKPKAKSPK
jgi:hypothetical protein